MRESLLVVAAIIRHPEDGRILLSQRPVHKHKGGCWEFPGGKVESGETLDAALARELEEELGLTVQACQPFMTIAHDYPELSVRLCFREVTAFDGVPHGREGQPVEWFTPDALSGLTFPEANRPVVTALGLPDQLLVLPSPLPADWPARLPHAIAAGASLVYLRGVTAPPLLDALVAACHAAGARALVADSVVLAQACGADGVHLRGRASAADQAAFAAACKASQRTLLCSMACHNGFDLERAAALSVDLALLAPVNPTATHPGADTLGWQGFQELAEGRATAVYALGGMTPGDLPQARAHGARGVAGISAFW